MGTLADKLQYLKDTKDAIMNAIIEKGVAITSSDTFRSYADKIKGITSGDKPIVYDTVSSVDKNPYDYISKDSFSDGLTSAFFALVDNLTSKIVGSLSNNAGIVSGFSSNRYVNDGINFTLDSQSYYIKFRLKQASVPRQSVIIHGEYLLNLECTTSKRLDCYCWKTNSSSVVLNTIEPYTWYYAIIRMENDPSNTNLIFKKYYISTVSFEDALNNNHVVMMEDNKKTSTSYSTYYGRSTYTDQSYADAFEIDFNETRIMNNNDGSIYRQYYQIEKLI